MFFKKIGEAGEQKKWTRREKDKAFDRTPPQGVLLVR